MGAAGLQYSQGGCWPYRGTEISGHSECQLVLPPASIAGLALQLGQVAQSLSQSNFEVLQ